MTKLFSPRRFLLLAVLFFLAGNVSAQSAITYPIAELGNCADREACKQYCSKPRLVCVDFAEKNGMVTAEEAAEMRSAISGAKEQRRAELSRDDIVGAIKPARPAPPRVERPGRPDEDNGPRINEDKAMSAVKQFGGPGGCTDMESCSKFCDDEENDKVCMDYAIEHNLMDKGEAEKMQKMMNAVGPGGCRGRECKNYCDTAGHEEECFAFAKENGMIPAEEVEKMEKMMNIVGPGGCKGRECEAYCNNPEHREVCFAFAKENGLMPAEEIERVEMMMKRGEEMRRGMGPEGEMMGTDGEFRDMRREGMDGRVEMNRFDDPRFGPMGPSDEPRDGERMGPPDNFVGPGGCKGRECESYCADSANGEECKRFFGARQDDKNMMMNEGGQRPQPPQFNEEEFPNAKAFERAQGMPFNPERREGFEDSRFRQESAEQMRDRFGPGDELNFDKFMRPENMDDRMNRPMGDDGRRMMDGQFDGQFRDGQQMMQFRNEEGNPRPEGMMGEIMRNDGFMQQPPPPLPPQEQPAGEPQARRSLLDLRASVFSIFQVLLPF